jgi:hypothetical protein
MNNPQYSPVLLDNDFRRKLACERVMEAPTGYWCKIVPPTRTLEQNDFQWPYLEGFSKQKQWPVNGDMCWLTPEEWKDILTAAFEKEINPRLASGFDGGVVMLGKRTSKFGKAKFSEWIEFLRAAAALKGVTPIYKNAPPGEDQWR